MTSTRFINRIDRKTLRSISEIFLFRFRLILKTAQQTHLGLDILRDDNDEERKENVVNIQTWIFSLLVSPVAHASFYFLSPVVKI